MIDESKYQVITHYNVAVRIVKDEQGKIVSIDWAPLNSEKCAEWEIEDGLN